MRCVSCQARHGQHVFRPVDPAYWWVFWPGPPPGRHPHADDRNSFSQRFVHASPFFRHTLEQVALTDGRCEWCRAHAGPPRCPRCQPTPPPGEPVPCALCGGRGSLAVTTESAIVDQIVRAATQSTKLGTWDAPAALPVDPSLPRPRRRRAAPANPKPWPP